MQDRFRKIILPYMIISVLFFLIFSFIYWLFLTKLALIDDNNIIFCNVFPALISGLVVLLFLRKRLKLISITDKYLQFILLISWLLLTAPTLTYQYYLYFENGDLTELENAYDILNNESSMFYSISHSSQLKDKSVMYVIKNRNSREHVIWVDSHFACPLTNQDDSSDFKNLWIGFNVVEKFSDRVFDDKEEQNRLIKNFVDSSKTVYQHHQFKTNYLKRLSSSTETEGFIKAIENAGLIIDKEETIILKEKEGDYKTRTGKSLWWTKFFLLISNITWILFTIFPKMKNAL